jgi:hypothetical protein
VALGRFGVSHESSDPTSEQLRAQLAENAAKLRESARTDPSVTVAMYDPKSDKYKTELSSPAPIPDGNPTKPKRARGAPEILFSKTKRQCLL